MVDLTGKSWMAAKARYEYMKSGYLLIRRLKLSVPGIPTVIYKHINMRKSNGVSMPSPSNVTYKFFLDKMGGTDVSDYIGRRGEIFYDPFVGVLKLSDGATRGGLDLTGNNYSTLTEANGGEF